MVFSANKLKVSLKKRTWVSWRAETHLGAICAFFVLSASISARIVRLPLFVDMYLGRIETPWGKGLDFKDFSYTTCHVFSEISRVRIVTSKTFLKTSKNSGWLRFMDIVEIWVTEKPFLSSSDYQVFFWTFVPSTHTRWASTSYRWCYTPYQ